MRAGAVDQVYLKFLDNTVHKGTFLKDYDFPPIFCAADSFLQDMLENFCVIWHFPGALCFLLRVNDLSDCRKG